MRNNKYKNYKINLEMNYQFGNKRNIIQKYKFASYNSNYHKKSTKKNSQMISMIKFQIKFYKKFLNLLNKNCKIKLI